MLIYACADQQLGKWLIQATNCHRLRDETILKAMDMKNLKKKLIKTALSTKDRQFKDTEGY
jgi:hypothetical protein